MSAADSRDSVGAQPTKAATSSPAVTLQRTIPLTTIAALLPGQEGVAEDVRLRLQLVQPVLDDVADAHDACKRPPTVEPLTLRIDATFIRHLRAVDAMSSQDTTQESLSVFRRAFAFEPARAPSRRSDSAERR